MTSVDRFHGRVLDVDVIVLGDELAVDAPIGSLELVVRDAGPFDETGGWLRLGTADGEILRYTSYDDDTDTIALQDATTQAWVTGDRVELWDLDAGAAAAEWVASVLLDDSADGDPDTATIAHDLIDALADGIRAVIGESAVLEREVDGSELELVDILGRVLVRDITTATASTPAAPTGLTLDTGTYVLGGRNQARILASWEPVTTNLDGDEISDLDHYVVQTKPGLPTAGGNWGGDYQVPAGTENVVMSPFTVDETHSVRVKAVNLLEFSSPWSEPASILASDDGTPPSVPSTPTTSSRLGTVKVFWDGRNSAGGLMEADFDYVEVHASTSASFVPTPGSTTTVIGRLYGPGYEIMSVGPTGYDTTWYFRLIAVDTSGNASAASARADNQVKPLVDVSNFPDDAMTILYARTGHFIELTAANFKSNLIEADFIDFGSLNGELITGLQIQTTATANRGIKIKNTGLEGYTSSGDRSFYLSASTGAVEILGGLMAGGTVSGATVETSSSSGVARVVMRNALNPAESGSTWGLLEFYNNYGWNPGRVWGSGNGSTGTLRLSSPYTGSDWLRAAAITLMSDSGGSRTMNLYAQAMEFTANTYTFTSWNGSSIDFRIHNAGAKFAIIDNVVPSNGFGRLTFEIFQGTNFAHRFAAMNKNNGRHGLELYGSSVFLTTAGSANIDASLIVRNAEGNQSLPQLGAPGTFPSLTFKSDNVSVTTWDSTSYATIKAAVFDATSDARYKSNQTEVTGALDVLRALVVSDYDTPHGRPSKRSELEQLLSPDRNKRSFAATKFRQRGVMAQQVAQLIPDAAYHDDIEDEWSVDIYALLGTTIAAVKELADIAAPKTPPNPPSTPRSPRRG